MSENRLIVRDRHHTWVGSMEEAACDRVIAALSADPQCMKELAHAYRQFDHIPACDVLPSMQLEPEWDGSHFTEGVLIDLSAKLISYGRNRKKPGSRPWVLYHNGCYETEVRLTYHLADDWLILERNELWKSLADERRNRIEMERLDGRSILFGAPLFEFVAAEVEREYRENRSENDYDSLQEIFSSIHARWLLGERMDLKGWNPRQWLLHSAEHIDACLECARENWTTLERKPLGIWKSSDAFAMGGAGYHEWIVYYDLVRHLIAKCWEWKKHTKMDIRRGIITPLDRRLAWESKRWLNEPIIEFNGRTPQGIIDLERQRIPEINSSEEQVIDCDCPLCAMMAEMGGISFWYMDDSHMDVDDVFTPEWEDGASPEWLEPAFHEDSDRSGRESLIDAPSSNTRIFPPTDSPSFVGSISVLRLDDRNPWGLPDHGSRECGNPNAANSAHGSPGLLIPLFEFGAKLGELISELKRTGSHEHLIATLMRDWGNLREVLRTQGDPGQACLIDPVIDQFHRSIDQSLEQNENLESQCVWLHQSLEKFSEVVLEV